MGEIFDGGKNIVMDGDSSDEDNANTVKKIE